VVAQATSTAFQAGTGTGRPSGAVAEGFRAAMRLFATSVTILSTEEAQQRYGMTATSVTSVAMDPPSLLVGVKRTASIHDPLRRRGAFCVNLLATGHEHHCIDFAGGQPPERRFETGRWGSWLGLPYLLDAAANLFCRVDAELAYGTHTLFVGRVEDALVSGKTAPLIYLAGCFLRVGRPVEPAECK
jgi:flavin reductase (DIM6/NTAB) family NADH-FMN oxidoreductase RutF